jgi:sulfatase maturation enzyme AslB (radical SAM superfamily)
VQKKEKKTIQNTTIERAVDFFYPFFSETEDVNVGFYGGEPLLAYENIAYTVFFLLEKNKKGNKKIKFCLTTNGSLLTEKMLDFFNRHKFTVLLSFDGLAQDKGRKRDTFAQTLRQMRRLQQCPGIHTEINSVFCPQTVGDLSESVRYIIEQKGPEITLNISHMEEWGPAREDILKKELQRLGDFLTRHFKRTGTIPVKNFRGAGGETGRKKGIFHCYAGRNRMAVTPTGELWGCFLFHDYFKGREDSPEYRYYAFGSLSDFITGYKTCYPKILSHYAELRQDYFYVEKEFCFLCPDVADCALCPVNAAYSTGFLGKISCRQCRLEGIVRNAQSRFRMGIS